MQQSYPISRTYGAAFLLGLAALVSPLLTHALGLKGTAYLPIFYGVAVGSAFLSAGPLLAAAVFSIALNAALSGMPSGAMVWLLLWEMAVFALLVSWKTPFSFWVQMGLSLLIARMSSAVLLPLLAFPPAQWLSMRWEGIPGLFTCAALAFIARFISEKK